MGFVYLFVRFCKTKKHLGGQVTVHFCKCNAASDFSVYRFSTETPCMKTLGVVWVDGSGGGSAVNSLDLPEPPAV